MKNDDIMAITLPETGGVYTHLQSRDMVAELKRAQKRHKHTQTPTSCAVHVLAKRAADMYKARQADSDGETVRIPVFPVLASNRGTSAEFRHWLAAYLAGVVVRGRYYGDTIDTLYKRDEAESLAHVRGFLFVEVDPADYVK